MEANENGANEVKHDAPSEKDAINPLAGYVGIVAGYVAFVTPPAYKKAYPNDPSKWPVFKIKPQDGLESNLETDDTALFRWDPNQLRYVAKPGAFRIRRLRQGVLDWKNFKDLNGKEIPCVKDEIGLTDQSIRSLTMDLQAWLILEISKLESVLPQEAEGVKF